MRLSHPMKILTILIGTLVLNMFDASNCRADETVTEAMLRAESLGGLRLGLPEKDVLKLLGSPATRGELVFQGADGNYVQDWHYPDKGRSRHLCRGFDLRRHHLQFHRGQGEPHLLRRRRRIDGSEPDGHNKER